MYVDDVDDLEELEYLRDQIEVNLDNGAINHPSHEQLMWDLEDINERIAQLEEQGSEFG